MKWADGSVGDLMRNDERMPQKSTIQTYITLLLLQTLLGCGLLMPYLGYATRCRRYPKVFIFYAVDGIHVLVDSQDEDAINAWFDDPALIEMERITLYPYSEVGPIEGIFEFYRRESFLSSPDDYRWQLLYIDDFESDVAFIHQELINIAKNDPYLSRFQPGAPERVQFLPGQTLYSLAKIGSYFGFPAFITWLIGYFKSHTNESIADRRRFAGQCIHCAYDCHDLPTPICPECGQNYTPSTSA